SGGGGDVEAVSIPGIAIVHHSIASEYVPVATVLERLFPKVDTARSIARHGIVEELIVSVFVTDRDAVAPVVFDHVVLKASVPHAPAEEQADLAIIMQVASFHQWPRAAGTRMNAIAGVPIRCTVQDLHVLSDLKRDAVAVVVPGRTAANGHIA